MKIHTFALILPLMLAACATQPTQTTLQLQDILRAERGPAKNPECLIPDGYKGQSHTALQGKKFDVPIRVIFPGTLVTHDHIANRLNFKVDKAGTITEITCG